MSDKKINEYLAEYNQIHSECSELYRDYATRIGLSDCAFWILYFLGGSDPALTQSEIVETIHIPKQTINSALKKLEKENLVSMKRIGGKKGKQIFLTENGKDLFDQRILPIIRAEDMASETVTVEEMAVFLSIFEKYTSVLKKEITECMSEKGAGDNMR